MFSYGFYYAILCDTFSDTMQFIFKFLHKETAFFDSDTTSSRYTQTTEKETSKCRKRI